MSGGNGDGGPVGSRRGIARLVLKKRRVAVVGGAGFLGSHLCERLVALGHQVVCFDNFHTGRLNNLAHLASTGRLEVVDHDITDPIPAAFATFDEIYNLGCPASPVHYQSDPVKTALTCSVGTLNCLQRARDDGAVLLHASTSEIYGDPDVHPQPESYHGNVNPVGPRSCYDEGKRYAETLITDFARRFGVTARIVRIFNTYGPRMQCDDGRVVSNFIVQALKDEDITIYGAGNQTRSFCYVDDLIDGLLRATRAGDRMTGPVNLGNPHENTVVELARIIIELVGSRSRLVHRPLPVDDPRRRKPDITRATEWLGWSPSVQLKEGLIRTIEYFENELRATGAVIVQDLVGAGAAAASQRL